MVCETTAKTSFSKVSFCKKENKKENLGVFAWNNLHEDMRYAVISMLMSIISSEVHFTMPVFGLMLTYFALFPD